MTKSRLIIVSVFCLAAFIAYRVIYEGNVAAPIRNFIQAYFVLDNGGVLLENTDRATVLSESAGLYLEICVRGNDRSSFDRTYRFVKKELMSDKGVLYWKVDLATGKKEASSASIDDLRVVKALLSARDAWKDGYYLEQALAIAGAVKARCVRDGYLVESFTWEKGDEQSGTVNISYLDLPTMRALAAHDPEWGQIFAKCRALALESAMASGLFREEFDLAGKQFRYGSGNMINQLLAALYLVEAGVPAQDIRLRGFLKTCLDKEMAIRNLYSEAGVAQTKDECAAVYALAARLFGLTGDAGYRRTALAKMRSFEIRNPRNAYFGGFGMFGPSEKKVFNSFDSFQALLTVTDNTR